MSMAATQFSADTPLLVMGLVATAGIFSLWRLWIYAIAFLLMGFILGASWRRAGVLTDAELTEIRYAGQGAFFLRAIKAFHMGTVINCVVLAMVLLAATRIAEPFLYWHEWLPEGFVGSISSFLSSMNIKLTSLPLDHPDVWLRSCDNLITILAIVGFTALYSGTGGLRGVVATDVMQFCIAMIATFAFAWFVVHHAGGMQEMVRRLGEMYGAEAQSRILSFGPTDWSQATFIFMAVLSVQWFAQVNADGTGYLAQRSMACQTDADARFAAVFFSFAQVLVRSLLWIPLALGLLILYPADGFVGMADAPEQFRVAREAAFAQGIKDFLPPGLRGLMLTGMLAALASTVDTHLNWGASYWTNDLYKRTLMEGILKRKPSSGELVLVARLSIVLILGIALGIMANLDSIQTAWHLSLLFGSGLGVVLILRWLWYRINLWSEVAAFVVSIILAPVLLIACPEMSDQMRLLVMVAVSTFLILVVTLVTPAENPQTLMNFYKKVRPMGFWKPIAKSCGEEPQEALLKLKASSRSLLYCLLSLFLLLIGMGKLMLGWGDDPKVLLWISFIVVGIVLVPVWSAGLRKSQIQ